MKKMIFVGLLGLMISCKSDSSDKQTTESRGEKPSDTAKTFETNRKNLGPDLIKPTNGSIPAHTAKVHTTATDLIIPRQIHNTAGTHLLKLTYPYLNEDIDHKYSAFNDFIAKNYLKANKALDATLDYQLFTANDVLLSMATYRSARGSGEVDRVDQVTGLNYDLTTGGFLDYDDFFKAGSKKNCWIF